MAGDTYTKMYTFIINCKAGFPGYDNQMYYCSIFVLISCVFCKITELDNQRQLLSAPEIDTHFVR